MQHFHGVLSIACWLIVVVLMTAAAYTGSVPFVIIGTAMAGLATYHTDQYLNIKFGDDYMTRSK